MGVQGKGSRADERRTGTGDRADGAAGNRRLGREPEQTGLQGTGVRGLRPSRRDCREQETASG